MRTRTPVWMLAATAGLVVLLAVLATLQYRWVGEVSRAERDRLRASMQTRADDFANAFDRQITGLFMALQVDAGPTDQATGAVLADREAHWRARATFPNLLASVYVLRLDRTPATLLELDEAHRTLVPAPWPAALMPLRDALRQKKPDRQSRFAQVLSFQTSLPALVVPILPPRPTVPAARILVSASLPAVAIALLDRHVLQADMLPALARRYLDAGGAAAYRAAILDRRSGGLVYSTDPKWTPGLSTHADVSRAMFAVQFSGIEPSASQPGGASGIVRGAVPREPAVGGLDHDRRFERFAITIYKGHPVGRAATALADLGWGGGDWLLLLQHRDGSLEAVVARSRRRNLLVSSGILLLVAASLLLFIGATRRAQRLAAQHVEFVASISHELRTPLAVIRSAGENLADGVVHDEGRMREYGDTIRREGRRLSELVDRALEFAAVASGRTAARRRPVAVADVVREAVEACGPLAREQDASIETQIDPALPPVRGDAAALRSVVQNLVSNAIKYGGADRWVGVRVQATGRGSRPFVDIAVEDHGAGIAPSDRSRVFEPFYRGRDATAAGVPGTGVGLSIVRRLVHRHGGQVFVERVGEVTRFVVRLPAAGRAADAGSRAVGHEQTDPAR